MRFVESVTREIESSNSRKEIFLEIGTGLAPAQGSEIRNQKYIGIDRSIDNLVVAKYINDAAGRKFTYVNADGQELPLKDRSVKTVVLKDVLGEPESGFEEILGEIKRVIKEDGLLIVSESVTPALEAAGFNFKEVSIEEVLERLGFVFKKILATSADYQEAADKYIGERAVSRESFIILANLKDN